MATTQSKTIVAGNEEATESYVLRKGVWFIFPINWWEKVATDHIGNDIHIQTDRPIRDIYFNGEKLALHPVKEV